jgi:hypothetical protein
LDPAHAKRTKGVWLALDDAAQVFGALSAVIKILDGNGLRSE